MRSFILPQSFFYAFYINMLPFERRINIIDRDCRQYLINGRLHDTFLIQTFVQQIKPTNPPRLNPVQHKNQWLQCHLAWARVILSFIAIPIPSFGIGAIMILSQSVLSNSYNILNKLDAASDKFSV